MIKIFSSVVVLNALAAAILFGASTPFAKQLTGDVSPILLAGLLYLGSGIGLILFRFIKDLSWKRSRLMKTEWLWLSGAILFGGVLAPILLMVGLLYTSAANASLFLNLESVFTAVLAWMVFKEHTDRRNVFGMIVIVLGGILLAFPSQTQFKNLSSCLLIAGACFCWAVDNNLTRKISGSDALFIAGSKGLFAGVANITLATIFGSHFPSLMRMGYALLIGFFGYGLSLVLFVLALRGLGAARTGAYFSTAPFIGATIAIIFFNEPTSILFWLAAILMGMGVWIHLTEYHDHVHTHESLYHNHAHFHDDHHKHTHDHDWDGSEPHEHYHEHESITHSHHHYPDIHHRHKHK